MTTTRHKSFKNLLANHAAGELTDLELVQHLAWAVENLPCDCLECSE